MQKEINGATDFVTSLDKKAYHALTMERPSKEAAKRRVANGGKQSGERGSEIGNNEQRPHGEGPPEPERTASGTCGFTPLGSHLWVHTLGRSPALLSIWVTFGWHTYGAL